MAVSKVETQITWAAANTKSLNSTSWFVSDEITLNDSDWEGGIQFRADNAGTPASGDTVEIRILYSVGDLDAGGGANDYPDANTSGTTAAQANFLALLDTYSNYDPDSKFCPIDTAPKAFKIAARAAQGATRAITLSGRLITHRSAIV